MDQKYKNYYENIIKEYTENNINGCNNIQLEFYKTKLNELKIKTEGAKANE